MKVKMTLKHLSKLGGLGLLMGMIPLIYILLLTIFSRFQYPQLLPTHFTTENIKVLLVDNPFFYKSIWHSLLVGGLTALISTVVGIITARAIVSYLGLDHKMVLLFVSLPLLIPSMPLFLGVHQLLLYTPFINHISGVVLGHLLLTIPYSTIICVNYFRGIPEEIESVAKTLGSRRGVIYRRVLLPLLSPGIALSFMIGFLISNTEYFSTFLLGGGNVITLSMVMYPYISNNDYGYASVSGLVFLGLHLGAFLLADWFTNERRQVQVLYDQG